MSAIIPEWRKHNPNLRDDRERKSPRHGRSDTKSAKPCTVAASARGTEYALKCLILRELRRTKGRVFRRAYMLAA